jgi:cytoskeletal protein RodZ
MKLNLLAAALAVTAFSTIASAQTTVIEERNPSVVVKEKPATSVTIEKPAVVKKRVTTGSSVDCDTKTVHKEGLTGSATVKKTRCD